MKLKHLFAWFVAFFALTNVFTSCSSDDDDDTLTTVVPDEMIGTWKFSELTLALEKDGKGSITTYTYSDDDEGGGYC